MAKRKKRSYRRRLRRWRRRVKPKIPLEVAGAGIAIPFVPARDGWASIYDDIQSGNLQDIGNLLAMGFAGIDTTGGGEPLNVMNMLNPFDLNTARYTKMLIWAGIASKVRKKFVKLPMSRVPLIGKYIS